MKWVAGVKSHGRSKVDDRFPIGVAFDVKKDSFDEYGQGTFKINSDPRGAHFYCVRSRSIILGGVGGDWDVYQVPETHDECVAEQRKCGYEVGDKVRIARRYTQEDCDRLALGYGSACEDDWDRRLGSVFVIKDVSDCRVTLDTWHFPYWCLERVEAVEEKASFEPRKKTCLDCAHGCEVSEMNHGLGKVFCAKIPAYRQCTQICPEFTVEGEEGDEARHVPGDREGDKVWTATLAPDAMQALGAAAALVAAGLVLYGVKKALGMLYNTI